MSDNPAQAPSSRELGEVIGTLKMTVVAVENLRETVDRLVQRAAFKSDIEQLRADQSEQLGDLRVQLREEMDELKAEGDAIKDRISALQRLVWIGTGILLTVSFIGRFVTFPARIVVGG